MLDYPLISNKSYKPCPPTTDTHIPKHTPLISKKMLVLTGLTTLIVSSGIFLYRKSQQDGVAFDLAFVLSTLNPFKAPTLLSTPSHSPTKTGQETGVFPNTEDALPPAEEAGSPKKAPETETFRENPPGDAATQELPQEKPHGLNSPTGGTQFFNVPSASEFSDVSRPGSGQSGGQQTPRSTQPDPAANTPGFLQRWFGYGS